MRKLIYITMAVALNTLASCQDDNELFNVQNKAGQTFYATIENEAGTRTALDEKNDVLWTEGDQISVFAGTTGNSLYDLESGKGTKIGKFVANTAQSTASVLTANAAYYPYDSNVTVSENDGTFTFNATFPATQTYSASGTFGNGASPMVAVTTSKEDDDFGFKNVGAIFRIPLKGTATITKIEFSANANLAGACQITASNTSTPTVNVTTGEKTITLNCGEGVQLNNEEATNFIVAMLPIQIEEGGITISIYDNVGMKMVYTYKAEEAITIARSKAYTTPEVTYAGNVVADIQGALYNATYGTVIQLEPGVNYGTLVFGQNANSKVVDITDAGGDAACNEHYSKYENITIIGAPGAIVDQIDFQVGWIADSGASYVDIVNLKVKDVTFSGEKIAFNMEGSKGSALGIDGLTIQNCKMNDTEGNDRLVFQQISGYKELTDKTTREPVMTAGVKNLTITGCEVTGAYMVIESRAMENLTITNNTFTGIKERDMLITSDATNHPEATYTGKITITGNTSIGGEERFVRASLNNSDAEVTISGNTITNYKGADPDWIKVTDYTGTLTIENNTCAYTVNAKAAVEAALKAATDGTIITLAAGTYDQIAFTDPANYKAKNITIIGEEGTTLNGFTIGKWSEDNYIVIDGLTFKNITFANGIYFSTKEIQNVTVEGCKFINDACIKQVERTDQLTNLVVKDCTFEGDGDKAQQITALMLENTKNLSVTGCTFTNIDYNVLQGYLTGTVLFDKNTVNGTGDRVFRFVNSVNVDVTISNNTITSEGDENEELAKASAPIAITLSNNTWNGMTDAEVAEKLINITAK